MSEEKNNVMKEIIIEKITLNIGAGESGPKLDKAVKLLENLTGVKAVKTTTKKRIPTWKVRPGLTIGTKVTLRGGKARKFLKNLFVAKRNEISKNSFDNEGNFAFGIPEYLDIEGSKYDAEIGIIGLEVAITLKRNGFRVKRRSRRKGKIPRRHRINKEEAIEFIKKEYGVKIQ